MTAELKYKKLQNDIRMQVMMLEKLLLKHDSKIKKNWGAVGDLGYVYSELVDIVNFLK